MSQNPQGSGGKLLAVCAVVVILAGLSLVWSRLPSLGIGEVFGSDASLAVKPHPAAATVADESPGSSPAPVPPQQAGATKPFVFSGADAPPTPGDCTFASLQSADAGQPPIKVYAAGAYAGRRLGLHIDGKGSEAGRIDVAVNMPGQSVALMLGSYDPTIWHVGWSKGTRIVAALVGGYHRQVITGLPKNIPLIVTTYDAKGPCGHFYVTPQKAPSLNPIARRAFGRPIDMVYPASDGRVLIGAALADPSGWLTDASEQPDTAFQVSPARAGGQAGLAYAVSQGWLREARRSDADAWLAAQAEVVGSDIPPIAGGRRAGELRMHNGYVVLKSFELPGGLYGAHSATFFVPKGVARPTGNPGHSEIYDFNTMTCAGPACGIE